MWLKVVFTLFALITTMVWGIKMQEDSAGFSGQDSISKMILKQQTKKILSRIQNIKVTPNPSATIPSSLRKDDRVLQATAMWLYETSYNENTCSAPNTNG